MKPTKLEVIELIRDKYQLGLTQSMEILNGMCQPHGLRDNFAAHALQGFIATGNDYTFSTYARWSYEMADEMMKARNEK